MSLGNVPPDRTLLQLLREDLGDCGTKEGCGEGDCGACTVVLGEARDGRLALRAVNSCIALAHSIDGLALWTVEDLARGDQLHPAQAAMVACHGSQCGFCTPGFVMSLFALHEGRAADDPPVSREQAQAALSGNLCRCTGYRPILEAAQQMAQLPSAPPDAPGVLRQLEQLKQHPSALQADTLQEPGYRAPLALAAALAVRAARPQAQVVAGCTDVGLWVTKQHRLLPDVLDLTRVAPLRAIDHADGLLRIGAAARLTEAYAALVAHWPQLAPFAARFAGLPVRNAGTLGGNVANGSPIGDSMPLLIALGAQVVLASQARGERAMPLEDFYLGYRKTALAADELLVRIEVPAADAARTPAATTLLRAYKLSKRFEDDISAVCLAVALTLDAGGFVRAARVGAGGVAATPARAHQAEAALLGRAWSAATAQAAGAALAAQFQPISDMRASSGYRLAALAGLMHRFWLESQGLHDINLESAVLEPL